MQFGDEAMDDMDDDTGSQPNTDDDEDDDDDEDMEGEEEEWVSWSLTMLTYSLMSMRTRSLDQPMAMCPYSKEKLFLAQQKMRMVLYPGM